MDGRRLEDESPLGAKIRRSGAWFTTAAPETGQAQTTMRRLLQTTRC